MQTGPQCLGIYVCVCVGGQRVVLAGQSCVCVCAASAICSWGGRCCVCVCVVCVSVRAARHQTKTSSHTHNRMTMMRCGCEGINAIRTQTRVAQDHCLLLWVCLLLSRAVVVVGLVHSTDTLCFHSFRDINHKSTHTIYHTYTPQAARQPDAGNTHQ